MWGRGAFHGLDMDETIEYEEGDVLELGSFRVREAMADAGYDEYDIAGLSGAGWDKFKANVKASAKKLKSKGKVVASVVAQKQAQRETTRQARRASIKKSFSGSKLAQKIKPNNGQFGTPLKAGNAITGQVLDVAMKAPSEQTIGGSLGAKAATVVKAVLPPALLPKSVIPKATPIVVGPKNRSNIRPRLTKASIFSTKVHKPIQSGGIFGSGQLTTSRPQPTQAARSAAVEAVTTANIVTPSATPDQKLQVAYTAFKTKTGLPGSETTRALFVESIKELKTPTLSTAGGAPMPTKPIGMSEEENREYEMYLAEQQAVKEARGMFADVDE